MNNQIKAVIAVAAIAIVLIAVFSQQAPAKSNVVKIGVLTSLTGSDASVGEDIRNAIFLALEEQQANAGNRKIQLIVEDDKCKASDGVNGFKKLVEVDQVSAVIGIACSGVAEAIDPIAEEKGVPVILSVASSFEPKKEKGWVFKFWPSNAARAAFEVKLAVEKLKAKDIAVIYVNNPMGVSLKAEFEKKVIELGGNIVAAEAFNAEATDFRTILIKIKSRDPDTVFVIAYEPSAVNILKQKKELGIEAQFLMTSAVISQSFLDSTAEISEGTIVDLPVTRSEWTAEFERRFAEKFNDSILHPGAYFAFDSIAVLADILNKTREKEEIKNLLYEAKTVGVSGVIEFDSSGLNKEKKEFAALIVRNGSFVPFQ